MEQGTGYTFDGKRVLVMGLGLHGGGLGAVKFLLDQGARVTVTDRRNTKDLLRPIRELESYAKKKKYDSIRFVIGTHRKKDFTAADYIVKNPGVRPDSPYLRASRKKGIPILSDITLFFSSCPAPAIGVTGTRGKSTTAYLIAEFLKKNSRFRRVWLGGNIRRSVLEFLPRVKTGDIVVLELSSFQLMDLGEIRKSPSIAVFTNLLNDHLNWHRTASEYARAKSLIFAFQKPGDCVFIPSGDAALSRLVKRAKSHINRVSLPHEFARVVSQNIGSHYISSAGLAVAVARHYKVPLVRIRAVLKRFKGMPSRQEEICVLRGIHFVNDTTATIPDAAIAALERFSAISARRGGKVILIAGGSDKKLQFRRFMQIAKRRAKRVIFLPGDATRGMRRELRRLAAPGLPVFYASSMPEAVRIAAAHASRGDTVLLSPGAASFGLFLNEFDRGEAFVHAVNRLS